MGLLRNPEIRRLAGLYTLLTLAVAAGGLWISAAYVLCVCAGAGALFYGFTARRYRRLSALSL